MMMKNFNFSWKNVILNCLRFLVEMYSSAVSYLLDTLPSVLWNYVLNCILRIIFHLLPSYVINMFCMIYRSILTCSRKQVVTTRDHCFPKCHIFKMCRMSNIFD